MSRLFSLCAAAVVAVAASASPAHAGDWGCGLDLGHGYDCWGVTITETVHVPPPVVKTTVTEVPTFTYETQLQPVTVLKPVLVKRPGPPKRIVTQHVIPQQPVVTQTLTHSPVAHGPVAHGPIGY